MYPECEDCGATPTMAVTVPDEPWVCMTCAVRRQGEDDE